MHVLFSPAAPPHQLRGAPGMSPGLSQSLPADPSPSCQHPSLLSPPSCWVQGRDGAWTGAPGALFSRTGIRSSRSCPALRAALGTGSAPLTDILQEQPSPSLGPVACPYQAFSKLPHPLSLQQVLELLPSEKLCSSKKGFPGGLQDSISSEVAPGPGQRDLGRLYSCCDPALRKL